VHSHARSTGETLRPGDAVWSEEVKDYYRNVEEYDWVDVADNLRGLESFFHRNRRRVVSDLVNRHGGGAPILDAGCGTGLNLARLPVGSVGLEINPRSVALLRQRLPEHQVVEGDIERMPFQDASFATVICTEVLEHVPNPADALTEILRVLRPDGVLIGSVPARSLIWKLRFLSSTCPGHEPFHNEYVPAEVRAMLGEFAVKRIFYSALRFNVMFIASRPSTPVA
jgi:SAM-dependent methyltransferase